MISICFLGNRQFALETRAERDSVLTFGHLSSASDPNFWQHFGDYRLMLLLSLVLFLFQVIFLTTAFQ